MKNNNKIFYSKKNHISNFKNSKLLKKTRKYHLTKSNKLRKQIYVFVQEGFGNKIFSLIMAIYLYNFYNGKCDINYISFKSKHDSSNDLDMIDIFPDSAYKVNHVTVNYQDFKETILKSKPMRHKFANSIHSFPTYEKLPDNYYVHPLYNLVYKMYKTFDKFDKNIFKINQSLIKDKEIINLSKEHYSLIHIRYGDKIYITNSYLGTEKFDFFIMYTPQYYIDMIKKLLTINNKEKIIIITDSIELVNEFIVKSDQELFNNENIILINANWLDSFYLFYNASNIVLSCSTFSMAGAYFNSKPNPNIYLNLYHDDYKKIRIPEEFSISPKWTISHVKKYILNYDTELLKKFVGYLEKK